MAHMNSFTSIEKSTVMKLILKLQTKSCELDELPTYFIKEHLDSFIDILTKIVNKFLMDGVFAIRWKTAILRPLLKKCNLDLIESNYRPVSNLSFISKLTESAAISQLNIHCDYNNLIPDHQSAYKENYSCETALVKFVNDVLWSMECKEISVLICLDLSAAFDTVYHSVLLKTLGNSFGVTDVALERFKSYLEERFMEVCTGDVYSVPTKLNYSVPQGSYGGPVLFNCYTASLSSVVPNSLNLSGFADDHTIRSEFKQIPGSNAEYELIHKMENCLVEKGHWMDKSRLKINPTKTELIFFGSRHQLHKSVTTPIEVLDDKVERTNLIKYLGAWLDEHLQFKTHVIRKSKTVYWNLYKLMHIRRFMDQKLFEILVYSMVLSHLDYANALLPGVSDYIINMFQLVQNWAAKLVLNRKKYIQFD